MKDFWLGLERELCQSMGAVDRIRGQEKIGGGGINEAWRFNFGERNLFVKINVRQQASMFSAEAQGLREIHQTRAIRCPSVLAQGVVGDRAYLLLEAINMTNVGDYGVMGQMLAKLHRHSAKHFGFWGDNTIGSTAQVNTWSNDWVDFFSRQRLRYQLDLAHQRGLALEEGYSLLEIVGSFFETSPEASLLHGDLWNGNVAFDSEGNPVVFDPACYYGDREADLAMSELFGGFPESFYRGYEEVWPLRPGYSRRKHLYNLYHILNHYNIFGAGYAEQARTMTRSLLQEPR